MTNVRHLFLFYSITSLFVSFPPSRLRCPRIPGTRLSVEAGFSGPVSARKDPRNEGRNLPPTHQIKRFDQERRLEPTRRSAVEDVAQQNTRVEDLSHPTRVVVAPHGPLGRERGRGHKGSLTRGPAGPEEITLDWTGFDTRTRGTRSSGTPPVVVTLHHHFTPQTSEIPVSEN